MSRLLLNRSSRGIAGKRFHCLALSWSRAYRMIGNAHTCINDREIIAIRDDGIEIKFTKPSGGVKPLRHIGDQSSKPAHMNWRLTPQTAKNFPAFELVEH